jgi:hypothetical protein
MSETEKVDVAENAVVETPAEEKVEAVEAAPAPAVEEVKEVPAPAAEETEGKGLGVVKGGAIGSTVVKNKKKVEVVAPAALPAKDETVALYSKKNYHWAENGGALKSGYNIVDKAKADKWLTLAGVRVATPEEVAAAFGSGK